ncbi:MAG: uracil-DNA glycosylase [Corynebacterium sp.]|nr:uracil-DNA glycosylase [Corynebacterium sp.]
MSTPISTVDAQLAEDLIHPEWKDLIRDYPRELIGAHSLPAPSDVFRALSIPPQNVKVLIVGQDPYPTPGHAMGLAFSVNRGVSLPRSLRNIYLELESDMGIKPASHGDLSAWTQQGVMLLNRVLTVRAGDAGSHRGKGWEPVTERIIRSLNRPGMVAVLWGRDAAACAPWLDKATVISSPHPSPLSARRGFFGSRPFSRVNAALCEAGLQPVDWRL